MDKKEIKIIFLDFDDIKNPLLGAGGARFTYELANRLVKSGHKVEVICAKYPGYRDRVETKISYKHIGIATKNIRINNILYILSLPFAVRGLKGDIIVECFTPPFSTLFSPLFTKIPVVGVPTSFEAERFSKQYHLPFHYIEKFGLKFYKYFIATTKYFDEKIRSSNPNVISIISPLGVNDNYFEIKTDQPRYILYLGRYDIGQKGLDMLIQAYSKIHQKVNIPLILVGFGSDLIRIKKLIRQYSLEQNVLVLGPKFKEQKYKILSKALFFVVPSRNEGFCLAALEALAVGIPVVSFDIPGLSWMTKDVSLKAKAFDIDDFAEKMIKASEREVNEKLRNNCRKFAESFSWREIADKYLIFFNKIIYDYEKK